MFKRFKLADELKVFASKAGTVLDLGATTMPLTIPFRYRCETHRSASEAVSDDWSIISNEWALVAEDFNRKARDDLS